ncbi:MAG: GxxExxY protein [Deltaproteobacteria bacterium]|nr:GxxExxY protein [Deltaproteobacteria bacterium]
MLNNNYPQITQIPQINEKDPRTHAIIGAAIEVHKNMGFGFLEAVYQEALSIEFELRKVPFQKEVELPIHYKERKLSTYYKADFLCYECIVVELKALNQLSGKEESQIINYLKATGLETGLLLNFGAKSLESKRFVFANKNLRNL